MSALVNQPSAAPSRKVAIGALSAIVTAALQQWAISAAEAVPAFAFLARPEFESGLPLLVGFGMAYLFRERAT